MQFYLLLPILSYSGILVYGVVARWPVVRDLGLLALESQACLAAFSRVETVGGGLWSLIAIVTGVMAGLTMRRIWPRPSRSDRKLWRQLFGELTVWEMLIHDPRLKNWRRNT